MKVIPVILAGGLGSRLWPLSRESMPKQFVPLFHSDKTLFQETILRLKGPMFHPPIILCQEDHRFMVAEQLRIIKKEVETILLEPIGRSTAPSVALAAFYALEHDPEAILLVLSADHLMGSTEEWLESLHAGLSAVESGYLVTFGVKPTAPETAYGYLKIGEMLSEAESENKNKNKNKNKKVMKVDCFVEKPNRELAQKYLDSGAYFWNSGIFLFKAQDYLTELGHYAPSIQEHTQQAFQQSKKDGDFLRPEKQIFEHCPADSIDYAVMEKSTKVAMVHLTTQWSDVGSWEALANCFDKDEKGNSVYGEGMLLESTECHIHATHRLVTLVGVENLVVVETKDAILVVAKNKAQEVKNMVKQLTEAKREEVTQATCVPRPWGHFESIDKGERYQVKRITIAVGAKLSLQLHHHRSEHWVVVKGTASVTRGDSQFLLAENQSTYIPIGVVHRLENVGKIPLEMIEIQSGAYLGEDDIIRLADNYGRENGREKISPLLL